MPRDPLTRNLIRCDACNAEAFCVSFDDTHAYYQCSAPTARHQWSEERDPYCGRCTERLSEHRLLVATNGGDQHLVCPGALEDVTFAYDE